MTFLARCGGIANWTRHSKTLVDSSHDHWVYVTPGGLGIVPVAPTVTFGGQTIYCDRLNTALVGLNPDDAPRLANRASR